MRKKLKIDNEDILHGEFDIKIHKKAFNDYFEAIIHSDGLVEYAMPSHQEKLILVLCQKLNKTRDEVMKIVPKEYYCDMWTWLCEQTGCILVWNDMYFGVPTNKQILRLKQLKRHGIYKGKIFGMEV